MRALIVYPRLPPLLDGIGDHTRRLSETLSFRIKVAVLTGGGDHAPIPGVNVQPKLRIARRSGVWQLAETVAGDPPDWLFLQYNPFSYGRWGLNLQLPRVVQAIRAMHPRIGIALMVHEPFVPITTPKFAVMTTWQRWQLWQLGRAADVVFFSIEPWVRRFTPWFPNKAVVHLPVGSNIPRVAAIREDVRRSLGVASGNLVVGLFGSDHPSRMFDLVAAAVRSLRSCGVAVTVLCVGTGSDHARQVLSDLPVIGTGALPAEEVSRHFAAMDLYLAPFADGVSTRRGSFMVALQHGLATLTTLGPLTDDVLRLATGTEFLAAPVGDRAGFIRAAQRLAGDAGLRRSLGQAAECFYAAHFDWGRIAETVLRVLTERRRRIPGGGRGHS